MANEGEMKKLQPEIVPGKFHKRGALAAVREDDVTNPEKLSSPTQFYIVLGNTTAYELMDQRWRTHGITPSPKNKNKPTPQ
jgi:hypothetical protein